MLILVQSKDEQRSSSSSSKKKDKRQLDHSLGQPYPNYRLERRISDGQHHYSPIQYYPGPPHLYRKGRPSSHSLPAPPYAVQMEPLIHYSQRDPLYDTNTNSLSSDVDPSQDLTNGNSVDRGGRSDTIITNKWYSISYSKRSRIKRKIDLKCCNSCTHHKL